MSSVRLFSYSLNLYQPVGGNEDIRAAYVKCINQMKERKGLTTWMLTELSICLSAYAKSDSPLSLFESCSVQFDKQQVLAKTRPRLYTMELFDGLLPFFKGLNKASVTNEWVNRCLFLSFADKYRLESDTAYLELGRQLGQKVRMRELAVRSGIDTDIIDDAVNGIVNLESSSHVAKLTNNSAIRVPQSSVNASSSSFPKSQAAEPSISHTKNNLESAEQITEESFGFL